MWTSRLPMWNRFYRELARIKVFSIATTDTVDYRLSAGSYFMMAAFSVPSERKYMIRVIGDSIGLRMLN